MDASCLLEGAAPLAHNMETDSEPPLLTSAEKRSRDTDSPEDLSGSRRKNDHGMNLRGGQSLEKTKPHDAQLSKGAEEESPIIQTHNQVAAAISAENFSSTSAEDELTNANNLNQTRKGLQTSFEEIGATTLEAQVAAAAAIANGAGSMAPLGIMGSIVNQARMIPQQPPPKPHQWSIQPGETVWRVDCDGERNRALIKTAVFADDGRLRFYTIKDLTLWDTEAAGEDEKVKPHLVNRCKPILV